MLGWYFVVFHSTAPESFDSSVKPPTRIAEWQTDINGLDWLEPLVREEKAKSLGGDGYPYKFTAMVKHLKPTVLGGPPYARSLWGFDHGDILTSDWKGKTCVDRKAWEACGPDEWLLIHVWDES